MIYKIFAATKSGSGNLIFLGVIVFMIVTAVVIMIIAGYREYLQAKQMEKENQYMEAQKNLLKEYYESLQSQIELTRRFRHDLANHIQMLEQLENRSEDKESLRTYARQLQAEYMRLKKIDFCDDMIIDAVLRNAKSQCEEKHIDISFEMNGFRAGDIEEIDLFSIFYRVLDMGMHMLETLDNRMGKPQIRLKSGSVAGHLIIQLKMEPAGGVIDKHELSMLKALLQKYDYTMDVLNPKENQTEIYISIGQIIHSV
ncbi:MAG: hypothetical protein PHC41_15630 [Lachnospiraceae bacterium]|nr:hypothetical protein [Lachnospiraceae bacterium]MDD3617620.1 hypothetical protein [Lachnospiraceae bacterium]